MDAFKRCLGNVIGGLDNGLSLGAKGEGDIESF